ncbi:MAG: hypothetical protein U0264_18480 [Candidatus Kapaibacterium sp.]
MSSGAQVEKDGKRRNIGPGFIIVFVKNASDGSRSSEPVTFYWNFIGGVPPTSTYNNGVTTFNVGTNTGKYSVSVCGKTQDGYIKDVNDDGYHTFLVP